MNDVELQPLEALGVLVLDRIDNSTESILKSAKATSECQDALAKIRSDLHLSCAMADFKWMSKINCALFLILVLFMGLQFWRVQAQIADLQETVESCHDR